MVRERELVKLGHRVFVPRFPTPENQSLSNWTKVFNQYEKYVDGDTIFVGHSLAPAFILSILERLQKPVHAAFFVAGFLGLLNKGDYDELNRTFITKHFDWKKIKQNCKKFCVISSDNDPYVPLEKGKELARLLGTDLIVIKNAGHINAEFGYTKFELLLRMIKEII